MRGTALLILLTILQSQESQVQALIEKLASEEIAVREQAAAKLVELGPAALPVLFTHADRADEPRRLALKQVIRRIERNVRVSGFAQPGPRVTLSVKDQSAETVLAEVSKQTGVAVDGRSLPDGTRLTLEASGLPLPAAIDALCRNHGKIAAQWTPGNVNLVPGTPRAFPAFNHGPYWFLPERVEFSVDRKSKPPGASLTLIGGIVGPVGSFPRTAWIRVKSAQDDRGRDLGKNDIPGRAVFRSNNSFSMPIVPEGERIFQPVSWPAHSPPSVDATRVKKMNGFVHLSFIAEYKTVVALKGLRVAEPMKETVGGTTFEAAKWETEGRNLRVTYKVTRPSPEGPGWVIGEFDRGLPIVLEDRSGRRVWGRTGRETLIHRDDAAGKRWEIDGFADFELPAGFEAETLELLEADELHTPAIPFELVDVPLQ